MPFFIVWNPAGENHKNLLFCEIAFETAPNSLLPEKESLADQEPIGFAAAGLSAKELAAPTEMIKERTEKYFQPMF